METRHVSVHYTKASWRHRGHYKHRFPKLSAICDTGSHVMTGAVVDRGPRRDVVEFPVLVRQALDRHAFTTLLGDAGYESEKNHRLCREELGVKSIFPTTHRGRGRHDGKPQTIRSPYRKQLHDAFPRTTYGQRWQIETAFSMIKRNLGSALRSRRPFALNREVLLRVITHNLMIIRRLFVFSTEQDRGRLSSPSHIRTRCGTIR
jgi:IS4 transposase